MRLGRMVPAVLVSVAASGVLTGTASAGPTGCTPAFMPTTWATLDDKYKGLITEADWQSWDKNGNGTLCLMYLPYNEHNPTTPIDPPFNFVEDRL